MSLRKLLVVIVAFCLNQLSYSQIDWPEFMSRQDMIWNQLPHTWYDSPFMGNGSLGSYICKELETNAIRVDINNSLAHDHRPDDRSVYGRGRLLTGYFLLHPVGTVTSGNLRLNLWDAITEGTITTTAGKIHLKAFVTSENPYIIVQATTEGAEKDFRWQFYPESSDSPRQLNASKIKSEKHFRKDYVSNPPAQLYADGGIRYCWQPLLCGGGTATAWKELVDSDKRTLVVTNAHTFPDTDAKEMVKNALANLGTDDLPVLTESHRNWWHRYYQQSFISLPDKKIENFYWAQIYKLASATRVGGGLLDNSGPWQVLTPWPNAWWNLNVQLSYWPVYTSNRLELGTSLVDAVRDNFDNLINNVPEAYRKDCAGLPVCTDFTLTGPPMPVPGDKGAVHMGNLPWLCHNLWLQYRYSMDKTVLRDVVYPALRRAVNFYLPFMERDGQGILHLKETYSPEYGHAPDCNYDLALLKWGSRTLLEASKILCINDSLQSTWQDISDNLTDYPQDGNGMMIGRGVPYERSHRHFSHLLMFYPLYLLNSEQPESKDLMEKSVSHWHGLPGNILGFSYTGASLFHAAFGNGDTALEKLKGLFAKHLRPNTMYKESGPVLETPLSGAQCVHEMLLQSWGGKIRVFPAVPSEWSDVSFKDLRTEGAFLVSAVRKGGATQYIHIQSLAGEPCVLRTDMREPVIKTGTAFLKEIQPGEYSLSLRKGESVTIVPDGSVAVAVSPVDGTGRNFFGLP